eukprot:TRINITY_DN928_c0_g1_i1.p1 TRINITY_DN928_c0_g1~~TRINITY_DN928_c0_g1_i1.p1  ORF type:complete len:432 (-),score=121.24 TRINITY_DN928_c0_g1_i1:86-1192(-)
MLGDVGKKEVPAIQPVVDQWNRLFDTCKENTSSICLVVYQLYGILKGYNDFCATGEELTLKDLALLNSHEEVAYLLNKETKSPVVPFVFTKEAEGEVLVGYGSSHIFPGPRRVKRMIKHYSLQYHTDHNAKVMMTSYPGMTSSPDSFYITTNGVCAMRLPLEGQPGDGNSSGYGGGGGGGVPACVLDLVAVRNSDNIAHWVTSRPPCPPPVIPPSKWVLLQIGWHSRMLVAEECAGVCAAGDVTQLLSSPGGVAINRRACAATAATTCASATAPPRGTGEAGVRGGDDAVWWAPMAGAVATETAVELYSRVREMAGVMASTLLVDVDITIASSRHTGVLYEGCFFISAKNTTTREVHSWSDRWLPFPV